MCIDIYILIINFSHLEFYEKWRKMQPEINVPKIQSKFYRFHSKYQGRILSLDRGTIENIHRL